MDTPEIEEEYRFKNFQEYRDYLDSPPEDNWLQNRSLGGGRSHGFIPIFITEGNADVLYRTWCVMDEKLMAIQNGVACTVKISATPDYPGAEEFYFTGTAAILLKEVAKNSVEFDVPNARERAIGKAFSTLGNVFGRNLNRKYKLASGKEQLVKTDFSFIRKAKEQEEE